MDKPLDIVIRFSTSHPDLILPVASPSTTTALTLKQRIRVLLPSPAAESKLRLIHAGRVVQDDGALSKSLHSRVAPPPRDGEGKSEKALGKMAVREVEVMERVYVHCSIGDALLPSELGEEKSLAEAGDRKLREAVASVATTIYARGTETDMGEGKKSTTPAPRGFDRLLSAGFTSAEVTTLRSQFMAIQSHSHTPDTMPTGADLLALEEQWLDNSNGGAGGNGATGALAVEEDGLDDLLRGSLAGFFWPIGGLWLMREEGVWSKRRQFSVLAGFAINLTFGFFKFMS